MKAPLATLLISLLIFLGTQALAEEVDAIRTWTLDETGYFQDAEELPSDTPYEVLEIVPPETGDFIQKWTKAYLMVKIRYEDMQTGETKEEWCVDGCIRPFGRNTTYDPRHRDSIVLDNGETVEYTVEEWVDLSKTPYSMPGVNDGTSENAIRMALNELGAQGSLSADQRYRVRCGFAAQGLGRLTHLAVPLWEVIVRNEAEETDVFVVYIRPNDKNIIDIY